MENLGPLTFVDGPVGATINEHQSAMFRAVVDGSPCWDYQWYSNGVTIAGGTGFFHVTPQMVLAQNGDQYRVAVTTPLGTYMSDVATLTVNPVHFATNIAFVIKQGQVLRILVAKLPAFAADLAGYPLTFTTVDAQTANGTPVVLANDQVTYTPPTGFVGTDRFAYRVGCDHGGTVSAFVEVQVQAATSGPPSGNMLAPVQTPTNSIILRFMGIPRKTYQVQRTTDLNPPVTWTTIGTAMTDARGRGQYEDTSPPPPPVFYRTVR
jgi:hypothetical protein